MDSFKRLVYPEYDIVGSDSVASIDHLDDVIARLPKLPAILAGRRYLIQEERPVGVVYLVAETAASHSYI